MFSGHWQAELIHTSLGAQSDCDEQDTTEHEKELATITFAVSLHTCPAGQSEFAPHRGLPGTPSIQALRSNGDKRNRDIINVRKCFIAKSFL